MNGEADMCAELDKKNKEAIAKLQLIGFPTECPIPEVSFKRNNFFLNINLIFFVFVKLRNVVVPIQRRSLT